MKPPVETIRVSSRGREILIKIKRNTGIDHWNEICRVALCRSLSNPSRLPKPAKGWDSAIEIEWRTFAGELSDALASSFALRAQSDGIDLSRKDNAADYFRSHIERGIASLQNTKNLLSYVDGSGACHDPF